MRYVSVALLFVALMMVVGCSSDDYQANFNDRLQNCQADQSLTNLSILVTACGGHLSDSDMAVLQYQIDEVQKHRSHVSYLIDKNKEIFVATLVKMEAELKNDKDDIQKYMDAFALSPEKIGEVHPLLFMLRELHQEWLVFDDDLIPASKFYTSEEKAEKENNFFGHQTKLAATQLIFMVAFLRLGVEYQEPFQPELDKPIENAPGS